MSGPKTKKAKNDSSSLMVAVRVRPFIKIEQGTTRCIEVFEAYHGSSTAATHVIQLKGASRFTFDHVLQGHSSQGEVYSECCSQLVDACMEGFNATIIAYGQTGSGKTYTMLGPELNEGESVESPEYVKNKGVVPRALEDLFSRLNEEQEKAGGKDSFKFIVKLQFLELYGEKIQDLLSPGSSKISIRDIGGADAEPEVIGATSTNISSLRDAMNVLQKGQLRRTTASTNMNADSSRSHAMMSVMITQDYKEGSSRKVKKCKFQFVDLAGSERIKKTGAAGARLKEGIDINKGLLTLGNVISALGDPKKKKSTTHIPYRDSKLTHMLKGSIGGNHKTLMITCVSPASSNVDETENTLRYANRAKNIQNKAHVNVDASSMDVETLKAQVKALATELIRVHGQTGDSANYGSFSPGILASLASGKEVKDVEKVLADLQSNDQSQNNENNKKKSVSSEELTAAQLQLAEANAELARLRDHEKDSKRKISKLSAELTVVKTENEKEKIELVKLKQSDSELKRKLDLISADLDSITKERNTIRFELETMIEGAKQHNEQQDKGEATTEESEESNNNKEQIEKPLAPPQEQGLSSLQKSLLENKISAYEKEIASLNDALIERSNEIATMNAAMEDKKKIEEHEEEEKEEEEDVEESVVDWSETLTSPEKQHEESSTVPASSISKEADSFDDDSSGFSEIYSVDIDEASDDKEEGDSDDKLTYEKLVEELEQAESKYDAMKLFYEDKIFTMESLIQSKEQERAELILEMNEMEQNKSMNGGEAKIASIDEIIDAQVVYLKVLPLLLEEENQRAIAQRSGLTDSILQIMALFPGVAAVNAAAFHALVLLARPLGGKEGALFQGSMINAGIFESAREEEKEGNEKKDERKSGINVMLDAMKRFDSDATLQAMGCWSIVNIALVTSQRSALLKAGVLNVISNAMRRHPFEEEVQMRAVSALVNLVKPFDNVSRRSSFDQTDSPSVETEQDILDKNVEQLCDLVVVAMKNCSSHDMILGRACLVLGNLSFRKSYVKVLLETPECCEMLEWTMKNYLDDKLIQRCTKDTLQRMGKFNPVYAPPESPTSSPARQSSSSVNSEKLSQQLKSVDKHEDSVKRDPQIDDELASLPSQLSQVTDFSDRGAQSKKDRSSKWKKKGMSLFKSSRKNKE